MVRKCLFFGTYAVAAVLLLFYREQLVVWMESDSDWHQDLLIVLIGLLIAVIPAIPYGIVAAVLGAKYGTVTGILVNVAISVIAAMIMFAWVRLTFSVEGRSKASNFQGIRLLTEFAERNAFMAILFFRLLPIVPAQAVNIFAAITRIRWSPYILATFLGKIPYLIVVTLLGDRCSQENKTITPIAR